MFDAAVNNAGVVTVPRLDGFKIDVEGAPGAELLLRCAVLRCAALLPLLLRRRRRRSAAVPLGGVASPQQCSPSDDRWRDHAPFLSSPPPAGVKRAVAEHKPKIVFLTSPNNPDGSMLSTEELLEILKLPVLVGAGWLFCAG